MEKSVLAACKNNSLDNIVLSSIHPIAKELVHKKYSEQVFISDPQPLLLNPGNDSSTEMAYFAYARPNLNCPVCFDHELDHYPLIALFEVARQMGIAVTHRFFGIPLKGFSGVVEQMTIRCNMFVELDIPLLIICTDTVQKHGRMLHRRSSKGYLVQNDNVCAVLGAEITFMAETSYLSLRTRLRSSAVKGDIATAPLVTNLQARNLYARSQTEGNNA
jgi:hypothetical protein